MYVHIRGAGQLATGTDVIGGPEVGADRLRRGRRPGDPSHTEVSIEGDRALGESVITNAAYTV